MAIKTFTTGEVLTSADTNTYLANSGLVYITQGVATSGTTLSITNCFSATYDAYRVVVSDFRANTGVALDTRLANSGTPFSGTDYYYQYTNTTYANTSTYAQLGGAGATNWPSLTIGDTGNAGGVGFDLFNPFLSQTSVITGYRSDPRAAGSGGAYIGYMNNTTSFSGLYMSIAYGALTSLKVRIYGYRQA